MVNILWIIGFTAVGSLPFMAIALIAFRDFRLIILPVAIAFICLGLAWKIDNYSDAGHW